MLLTSTKAVFVGGDTCLAGPSLASKTTYWFNKDVYLSKQAGLFYHLQFQKLKSPKQCFSLSGGLGWGWGFGQFPEHKCPWPSQSESEGGTQKSLKNLRKLPSRFKQHPFRCPASLHTWQRTALYHFIQVLPLQKLAHSAVSWGTYTRTPLWNRIQMKRFRCLGRACAVLGYALSGMLWLTLKWFLSVSA